MHAEPSSSPPRQDWIVTFADMMSLLLAFFILLVSLNGLKQDRREDQFQSMMSSLRNRFGQTGAANSATEQGDKPRKRRADEPSAGRAMRSATLEQTAHVRAWNENDNAAVAVRSADSAGARSPAARVAFAPGSDVIDETAKEDLRQVMAAWQRQPRQILVKGYSTGALLAAPSAFRDEWDLAYERCHVVVERLTALGVRAEYLCVGVSPLRGVQNDQIDVVLLNELTDEVVVPEAQDAPPGSPANP